MSMLTDIGVDPAGNVWAVDNWVDQGDLCFVKPPEALSTQCGGNGMTVFYGVAKPVRTPMIGPPARAINERRWNFFAGETRASPTFSTGGMLRKKSL